MLPGFSGALVSEYFAEQVLPDVFAGRLGEASREAALRKLTDWWRGPAARLGPSSSLRSLFDHGAAPLFELLGFSPSHPCIDRTGRALTARLAASGLQIPLLVLPWGEPLDHAWSDIARLGLALDAPWIFSFNGREVRLSDGTRTHARRHSAFELEACLAHPTTFVVTWALLRAAAFLPEVARGHGAPAERLVDVLVREADRQEARVCGRLRQGVVDALEHLLRGFGGAMRDGQPGRGARERLMWTYEQAITVVYRVLFLLFAEARGLVPVWHPHYREGYTIEALCAVAERPGPPSGLWEALQAISRMAHAGCDAGTLHVTPFNGRLFAPGRAPLAETRRIDDEAVRRTILALATQPARQGRARVAFRDLDVEQLGAVYESVLDYEPAVERPSPTEPTTGRRGRRPQATICLRGQGDRRKSSGTFYTPRAITDYLVRRTLAPLVSGLAPGAILDLRVLDPAMGSGAFLVAACRYLADAYEGALVRSGACQPSDLGSEDRAGFRRLVAQRCLFGVDLNPMAVQVGRLSLWLTSLSADKPLTFLDHHLVTGNSLVGASVEDLWRTARYRGGSRARALPLFDHDAVGAAMSGVLPQRRLLAEPDDTVAVIREKERTLASLSGSASSLSRWASAADLWCARWFWDESAAVPVPSARETADLIAGLAGCRAALPPHVAGPRLDLARRIARARRFFHWTLRFPEVFFEPSGAARADAGFDAMLGNPPWDVIRADRAGTDLGSDRRPEVRHMAHFVRESGIYSTGGEGHPNQYHLFLERTLQLLRPGGRLGIVVPWGLAADRRSTGLRRVLFERCELDTLVSFENAAAIFPIHRGLRFVLVTASAGRATTRVRCLLGATDPGILETLPDVGGDTTFPISLRPDLLRRVSGPGLEVPHVRSTADLALLERMCAEHPRMASPEGWGARFGRELNATDDRRLFGPRGAIAVLEGKHVEPFVVHTQRAERFVESAGDVRPVPLRAAILRPRLAYRDVASAGNRLTFIAAILPPDSVAVHTLFSLRTRLDADEQAFLCGVLNSFVANYLARLRVTTHLGAGIGAVLPVPRPPRTSAAFSEIASLSRHLEGRGEAATDAYCRLQARVAQAYGLTAGEFRHVLESFPLVEARVLDASWAAFAAASPIGAPDGASNV